MSESDAVVSRYVDHMRVRNLRHWTIYNRQRALARLREWAQQPILYLTQQDLERWQAQRMKQIQPEPVRTEMSAHRNFFQWCCREGLLAVDPTARLDLPRVSRRLPRPITDAKLADALTAADDPTRAILGLAAFAGLRACEIAGLDWAEVGMSDSSSAIRVVNGKGGHGRIVPISTALTRILHALPDRRGPVIKRIDGLPGRCAPHRISSRANNFLHEQGITETLHQCRHRFASSTYQACQDIRAVQDLLGHASPTTTAIYAAAASNVAKSAVEAAGSLAA